MQNQPYFSSDIASRHVSTGDEPRPDTTRFTLTVEDAAALFAQAGVPRSPRTITRFCQLGDLECLRVETEKNSKWLVDRNSAERRIKELQQALQFTDKPYQDMTGHVAPTSETKPDTSRHVEKKEQEEITDKEKEFLQERIENLENEVIQLKIDKQSRELMINQLATERKEFIAQLKDMSFELGAATTKLQQLEAPRPEQQEDEPTGHVETRDEIQPQEGTPASPEPSVPEPPKPGFFTRLFG